ncbi:MAG: DUF3365 domain-containing protein [Dokdonella sp.]
MKCLVMALAVLAASSNGSAATPDEGATDALTRAQAAATDFSARLRQALQKEIAEKGVAAAVDFCRAEAPVIATAVMAEHDVRLGRVALQGRNRNPANAPGGWQAAALSQFRMSFEQGVAAADLVFVQRDHLPADTQLRLLRGIAMERPCLACHGHDIAPPVAHAIARNYPDDGATGFEMGDLRGALWVEVPAAKSASR